MPPTIRSLFDFRSYIWQNAWYSLHSRYAGSMLGLGWTVLVPLMQAVTYTFVFVRVLGLRTSSAEDGVYSYVLHLTVGLFPWSVFAQSVIGGCQALRANGRELRSLAIPEEVFVATEAATGLIHVGIYLAILTVFVPLLGHPIGWTVVLMPVVAVLFQLLAFGATLALASVQVLFQDVRQVVTVIVNLTMWTLPIVYPEPTAPDLQALLAWHPIYPFIRAFRTLMLDGTLPAVSEWASMLGWATVAVAIGAVVVGWLRPQIRDLV